MTKLLQHIEEMRARLHEIATSEKVLIRALGEALDQLDQQLLRDVRHVTCQHEARREVILGELQGLAASIGMFHPQLHAPRAPEELPNYMPQEAVHQAVHQTVHQAGVAPGDWREATRNIAEDFSFASKAPASSH
jgi:hypothetical protein